MKITILTLGTRGDVQPFVALGIGLQQAGYSVTIATESGFADFVQAYGLDFAPLQAEFIQLAQTPEGQAVLAGKGNRLKLMKELMPMLRVILEDAWKACQDADAIIYHPKVIAGPHIAEKLNIPAFLALALPAYSPTRTFANPAFGGGDYGRFLNRLSYTVLLKGAAIAYRGVINTWRRETLGLPPFQSDTTLNGKPIPKLYAYSPHIVPIPPDWDDSTSVTGYWFLPAQDWQPPAALTKFLESGPAPVYVGFGSMPSQDAAHVTQTVLRSLQLSGQRAILASGWGGLSAAELPESVFMVESVPHDWLFPRCSAVIHHGGSGTTGAGLRAGKPTLICPFFGDQPFWGKRVFELGVGPRPIAQKELTAETLAQAIRIATTNGEMRDRALALAFAINAENGVDRAVEIINKYTDNSPREEGSHTVAPLIAAGYTSNSSREEGSHAVAP